MPGPTGRADKATRHAARQADPDLFDPASYAEKEIAPGVALILAKKKDTGADAPMETQSVRFDASKFSPEQAAAWCKVHEMAAEIDPAEPKKTENSEFAAATEDLIGVEITREGTYRDSVGTERRFDAGTLDAIAAAGPAPDSPLKFGHGVETNGWVKRLLGLGSVGTIARVYRRGTSLLADLPRVPSIVAGMIRGVGRVPVSAEYSVDAQGRPARLVGLALVPNPAMKNLAGITPSNLRSAFAAAADRITVALRAAGGELALFEEQPDQEEIPMTAAELKALFAESLKPISDRLDAIEGKKTPAPPAPAEFAAAIGEATERALKPLADRLAAIEAGARTAESEGRKREVALFCERQVREGRLLPAHRAAKEAVLLALPREQTIEFSEAGKPVKRSPYELEIHAMERGPIVVRFGEAAAVGATDGEPEYATFAEATDAELEAARKSGNPVSRREAAKAAAKKFPALADEGRPVGAVARR